MSRRRYSDHPSKGRVQVIVSPDISWQAHQWLGDTYGWTKGIEYHCLGDYTVPAYFYIRDPQIAMLFKLMFGGK